MLYDISNKELRRIDTTTFSAAKLRERDDLQKMLKENIEVVSPDTLVIAEEFGDWDGSRRRIDLLGLDKQGKLVVIELKRSEDGGHMELQALRYSAMVSKMTFSEAVKALSFFKEIDEDDAERQILEFLDGDEAQDNFGKELRIVLVSAEFSKEITTTVMWLSGFDIDISCIKIQPYRHDGKILLDVQKIFPLPEAEEYQIKIRRKEQEERSVRTQNRDMTRFDLDIDDQHFSNLPKRELVLRVVSEAIGQGNSPEQVIKNRSVWVCLPGKLSSEEFLKLAKTDRPTETSQSEIGRFFTDEDQLFRVDGKTYAVTKMWGSTTLETVEKIIKDFGLDNIEYHPVGMPERRQRQRIDMGKIGIQPGSELYFSQDEKIKCVVTDATKVRFEGKETSLSASALEILRKMGKKWPAVAGSEYWMYDDETLDKRRRRLEDEIDGKEQD